MLRTTTRHLATLRHVAQPVVMRQASRASVYKTVTLLGRPYATSNNKVVPLTAEKYPGFTRNDQFKKVSFPFPWLVMH
jgi:hypothetical protein